MYIGSFDDECGNNQLITVTPMENLDRYIATHSAEFEKEGWYLVRRPFGSVFRPRRYRTGYAVCSECGNLRLSALRLPELRSVCAE